MSSDLIRAVIWDPLVPLWLIAGLAVLVALALFWAVLSAMRGAFLRGAAGAALLLAIANPSLREEDRQPLKEIALILVDESPSALIGTRPAQTAAALADLQERLARTRDVEVRLRHFGALQGGAGAEEGGSFAMAALSEAMAEIPRERLGAVFVISDGQIHDAAQSPDLPAPLHLLLTGAPADWDRRLVIREAPAFALIGEPVPLVVRIEDQGAAPAAATARLVLRAGAAPPQEITLPVGQDVTLQVTLSHAGTNVIHLALPAAGGELTERNNEAVLQINGLRDRLRVLLVSGEPHAGERVWRNLLKSDPSVDLVHFTILRPPEKQDGVPVSELSLIAFPTRELFVEKVREFDLIIFDRYRRRGIMPMSYLENVRDYVRAGGAVLVSAGPEFGSADSLWRSPLADILPVTPSSRVIEGAFRPRLTEAGARHPVTMGLDGGAAGAEAPPWGQWFRQLDLRATSGQVVMEGEEGRPLLVLDRVGEGRVGMLGSDQIWLWGRGYDGGGPQLELLRRLAHWTMKEPDLEEETLTATARGLSVTLTRRSMGGDPGPLRLTRPDGGVEELTLSEKGPGLWQHNWEAPVTGLYRMSQGDLSAVFALGPAAPREFIGTIASAGPLEGVVRASGGGVVRLSEGSPDIRRVREGRALSGRGWLGLSARGAYVTADLQLRPLLAPWGWALLILGLMLAGWLREGQRRGTN